jgi:hypothetical protein
MRFPDGSVEYIDLAADIAEVAHLRLGEMLDTFNDLNRCLSGGRTLRRREHD